MQTYVLRGSVGWVDARGGMSYGGRKTVVAAHSATPFSKSARAIFRPVGGHFFEVAECGARTTTSRNGREQPKLSLSAAATSSHGDDADDEHASLATELRDLDTARSDDENDDPMNVAHPLSFALQKVLGRFQSVVHLIRNGGLLTALLATRKIFHRHTSESDTVWTAMSAGLFGVALTDLSGNLIFMSAFWSWLTAQMMKYVTAFYREGTWDWRVMFDSGGMPSSHTSLVVGLTTAIAYQYGLGSTLFPLSLAFSLIVMYDAAGVRRHAGKQAAVLNKILENMFHGESVNEDKLKEVLGHSPLQVLAGAVLGVFIGVMYMHKFGSGYAALA